MNTLIAQVKKISSVDNLNIIKFDYQGIILSMMSLELNSTIVEGTKVKLTTKSTHIAIAKEFSGFVSYSNQLSAKIIAIQNGELLSSIKLQLQDNTLESIITYDSCKRMELKVGDDVTAFIKANELSIAEILDD